MIQRIAWISAPSHTSYINIMQQGNSSLNHWNSSLAQPPLDSPQNLVATQRSLSHQGQNLQAAHCSFTLHAKKTPKTVLSNRIVLPWQWLLKKHPDKSNSFVAKKGDKDEPTVFTVSEIIYAAIFSFFHLIFLCFGLLPHSFRAIHEPVLLNS